MSIRCPHCEGPSTLASSNRWRPFCSERCRMVDLGAWLDGDYSIPGERVQPASRDERLDEPPEA